MKRTSWFPGFVPVALCLALAGLVQPAVHAVDTTPPVGAVIINNYRSVTDTTDVTLALNWDDGIGGSGVSLMRFSDDGAHWSAWEPVAATRAYTLPPGSVGHRTVRVQYLDKANNRSAVYSDYIHLITHPDTTPPTGTIVINSNIASTAGTSVVLELSWDDGADGSGVSKMRFSDDGSHWTAWLPPEATGTQTTRLHILTEPTGYKTVRAQYLDRAGNRSAVCSDYIKYAPTAEKTVLLPGGVPLVIVWIPGGTFMMGRHPNESESTPSEDPQHSVTLGGFWMAKYELTKRQWLAVMGTMPWSGQENVLDDLDSPAVFMSWDDAQSFLAAANSSTGKAFSLPSEAQWEYACRAGTQTWVYWGDDNTFDTFWILGNYAWEIGNAELVTGQQYAHVVGLKLPNAFGLYDMMGNVLEWCEDDLHSDYTGAPTGGQAWVDAPRGSHRVMRGGDWRDSKMVRSARRLGSTPGSTTAYAACVRGFRVALTR